MGDVIKNNRQRQRAGIVRETECAREKFSRTLIFVAEQAEGHQ